MIESLIARPWHAEFSGEELVQIREAIPAAVHAGHVRSAKAHVEYADPDGDQYVYGAGMSRGVGKELEARLQHLPSFHRVTVDGTSRRLMLVGDVLLFPIRVGKKMPRNHHHVRIAYLPDVRRGIFAAAGMTKYEETPLEGIDMPSDEKPPTQDDALKHIAGVAPESLIVPYYSCDPHGVGSIYWAPASLSGRYLNFSEPERLAFVTMPSQTETSERAKASARKSFADGQRPRTETKLRGDRKPPQ
jgi:hypothetical protein